MFDRLDANHNGVLDPQGVATLARSLPTRSSERGDGKISRDESANFIPDQPVTADADVDQTLSLRELRSPRRWLAYLVFEEYQ